MKRLLSIALTLAILVAVLPMAAGYAVAAPAAAESAPVVVAEEQDVRLFPNPVENELNVLCEKYDVERLVIFGASGEVIFSSPMAIPQGSRMTINMSSRTVGYYTLKVWLKGVKQPLTYRILKI